MYLELGEEIGVEYEYVIDEDSIDIPYINLVYWNFDKRTDMMLCRVEHLEPHFKEWLEKKIMDRVVSDLKLLDRIDPEDDYYV